MFHLVRRRYWYALPLNWFVPERVWNRIWTAPWPELSAPGFVVDTVTSSTASRRGLMNVKNELLVELLSAWSWVFRPSIVMFRALPGRPMTVE